MTPVDETSIRDQLARAVDILDPAAPPLAELESRAAKRRRTFRLATGFGAVALAGACAAVVAVVVITAGSGGTAKVTPAAAPSASSLADFAAANGALGTADQHKITGPLPGTSGYYGAFIVRQGVSLAAWDGSAWQLDGATITKFGKGKWILRVAPGPALGDASTTPSVYVRGLGGSVSYFGFVLRRGTAAWHTTSFGGCGHHKLCYTPSDSEPYGRPGNTGFVSVNNSCTPDCAAGNEWRVDWRWDVAKDEFVAVHTRKV